MSFNRPKTLVSTVTEKGSGSNDFSALITPARKSGAVKAYADVRIETLDGALVLRGFSVVQKPGQSPWVGLPQKPRITLGLYAHVVPQSQRKAVDKLAGVIRRTQLLTEPRIADSAA